MGGRAGGGARGGAGGSNPYRSEYSKAYDSSVKEIQGAIQDAVGGNKSAAAFLKNEVLAAANPATAAAAKNLVKSNPFAYMTTPEINTIHNGAYAAAAIKMKGQVTKALKSIK